MPARTPISLSDVTSWRKAGRLTNRMWGVSSRESFAMSLAEAVNDQGASARALYEKLEDRVLARDQVGASECYYDLVRDGRPLPEMLREAVRIHGPYTHVPYHERIDDGFINFVNNDHCLLSARATLHLSKWLPAEMAGLAMAQTIWYIPTGLDIWNQKIK